MGMILVAQVYFFLFFFLLLFKISFRFGAFWNPTVVKEISINKELNTNECVRWIEAFIANLGHPLWGSQSMQELASGMRNFLPFLIRVIVMKQEFVTKGWLHSCLSSSTVLAEMEYLIKNFIWIFSSFCIQSREIVIFQTHTHILKVFKTQVTDWINWQLS